MNNIQNPNNRVFDLEKRTTEFAKRIIRLCKSLPKNPINNRLIGQIVGSAGSVGANYREANDALGKKGFPKSPENFAQRSKRNFALAGTY